MSKVHLIYNEVDDYEALYVDGVLTEEGSPINEGMERIKYFLNLAHEFDFDLRDIVYGTTETEDGFTYSITELSWHL